MLYPSFVRLCEILHQDETKSVTVNTPFVHVYKMIRSTCVSLKTRAVLQHWRLLHISTWLTYGYALRRNPSSSVNQHVHVNYTSRSSQTNDVTLHFKRPVLLQ